MTGPDVTPSAAVLRRCAAFEEDVVAGRVSLVEVVEAALSDLEEEPELCPRCAARPVSQSPGSSRTRGVCYVCILRHLSDMQRETVATLEAQREYAQLRKETQRLRDELDPGRPRSREYNRSVLPSTSPIMQECATCGRPFPPHGESFECAECLGLRARRDSARRRRAAPGES